MYRVLALCVCTFVLSATTVAAQTPRGDQEKPRPVKEADAPALKQRMLKLEQQRNREIANAQKARARRLAKARAGDPKKLKAQEQRINDWYEKLLVRVEKEHARRVDSLRRQLAGGQRGN